MGVVTAKLLGPALFGIRNAFVLALDYESRSDLGTYNAMVREVPYYRGSNNYTKAYEIESSVLGANALYALLIGFMSFFAFFYMRAIAYDSLYVDIVLFFGLFVIVNKIKDFYTCKFIIEKNVSLLSKLHICSGFASLVLCIPLTYYLSLKGLFIGLLIVDLMYIFCIAVVVKRLPSMHVNFTLLRELLKIGFPMTVTLFSLTFLTSADRIIIITMLSEEALGYYAVGAILIYIFAIIPEAIHSTVSPALMEKLGRNKDIHGIINYFIEPTVLVAYLIPYMLGFFYFSIHIPIQYYLVKYIPSVDVVKLLTPTFFFGTVSIFPTYICYALNKQIKLIFIACPMILLNMILNYILIQSGLGIKGVAIGTDVTNFIFCSLMLWYTFMQFKDVIQNRFKYLFLIYAPFLYSILLILIIDNLFTSRSVDFFGDAYLTFIKIIVYSIVFSFIFVVVKRQTVFINLINNISLKHYAKRNPKSTVF